MALKFEYIIDIAANSISPSDVHQTYIINEVKGDIVDYYRKDFNAAEKTVAFIDRKGMRLTPRCTGLIGIRLADKPRADHHVNAGGDRRKCEIKHLP